VQLKELNHNNIKAFIGACVEPGHICYLMQICSRGSVQVTLYQNHKLSRSSITYSVWRGAVMVTARGCGRWHVYWGPSGDAPIFRAKVVSEL